MISGIEEDFLYFFLVTWYLVWDSGVLGFFFSIVLSEFFVLIEKYTTSFCLGKRSGPNRRENYGLFFSILQQSYFEI